MTSFQRLCSLESNGACNSDVHESFAGAAVEYKVRGMSLQAGSCESGPRAICVSPYASSKPVKSTISNYQFFAVCGVCADLAYSF